MANSVSIKVGVKRLMSTTRSTQDIIIDINTVGLMCGTQVFGWISKLLGELEDAIFQEVGRAYFEGGLL